MTVTSTSETHLAFTNFAYCSPSDLLHFAVPGSAGLFLANVADVFILSLSGHESINDGTIALNDVQRKHANVSHDSIVTTSRFVPPDSFDLALLVLELEFFNEGTKNEVDAVLLSTELKRKFIDQVLTVDQRVTFEYLGTTYIFTVIDAEHQYKGISISGEMRYCVGDGLMAAPSKGFVDCGDRQKLIYERVMFLVEQVKVNERGPPVTCLLQGPNGCGKTTLAATVGIGSDFPYAKIISAESMIGLQESQKCEHIIKVFEDAYKSPLSIVILDNIESLLEYTELGQWYSKNILNTLSPFLKSSGGGSKLLVLGTTSNVTFLQAVGLREAFFSEFSVPLLRREDAKKVLEQLNVFSEDDIEKASEALNNIPIKQLYYIIEMAAARDGRSKEPIYIRKEKLDITHFLDCLREVKKDISSVLGSGESRNYFEGDQNINLKRKYEGH